MAHLLILLTVLSVSYHWSPPTWWPRLPKVRGYCAAAVIPALNWRTMVGQMLQDTTKRAVEFYWAPQDGGGYFRIDGPDTLYVSFDSVHYAITIWRNGFSYTGIARGDCALWRSGMADSSYWVRGRAFGMVQADSSRVDTVYGAYGDSVGFVFPRKIIQQTTLVPLGIIRVDTVDVAADTAGS